MPRRWVQLYTIGLSAVLLFAFAAFIGLTYHWPLVGDAPLFHYVVFLSQHGLAPYREIVDLNLPGTYVAQAFVMRVLGESALAWRCYDFGLLLVIGLAMGAICGPGRRFAAFFAAGTFALIHGRDGLIDTGQRDLLMAALLLLGCAALLRQRPRAWTSFSLGLAVGAAATVKPLALLLLPVWLALYGWRLRADRQQQSVQLALALAGALVPLLACALALRHWHAWDGFREIMLHLAPLHAGIFRWPLSVLLSGSVSSVLLGVFLLWLPLLPASRQWRSYGGTALLSGFVFGVISYVAQGRGYPYHRYPSEAFFLLLAGLAFQSGLSEKRPWVAVLSIAGLAFGSLVIVPRSLSQIRSFDWRHDDFGASLAHDLQGLGGPALDGKVQCLDQAGGCLAALYQARLTQSTGYLYDCYLFIAPADAAQTRDQRWYRDGWAQAWAQHTPEYVIVTSDECGLRRPDFRYFKQQNWPWLNDLLASEYTLVRERVPTARVAWGGVPVLPYGYRIYRKLSPKS